MADDRMKNDDRDRNMGGASKQNKGNYGGQQSPGRTQQDDEVSTGQRGTDQGHQSEPKHMKDEFGTSERSGAGQGRQGGNQDL